MLPTTFSALRLPGGFRSGVLVVATCVAFLSSACAEPDPVETPDAQDVEVPDAGEQQTGDDVQAQVPSPPRNVVATAGDGSATVTWAEPVTNGGRAVTGYVLTASDGTTVEATTRTARVEGLTNGKAYTFKVVARNAIGDSAPSETSNEVTPFTVPGAPSEVVATAGLASARVSWQPPADDGGSSVISYAVAASNGTVRETTSTSIEFQGLINGATYTFVVIAINAAGQGAKSAPSNQVTPVAPPGAPQGVLAERGDAKAIISWVAPLADGGSPITHYEVTANDGAKRQSTTTTVEFDGLTVGVAYWFTVTAHNAYGPSAASIPSNEVVIVTVPSAPRNVVAERGDGSVTLTWDAPLSNGGATVSQYDVHCSDGRVLHSGSLELYVEDLVNGEAYTFTVYAVNAVGQGPASQPSEEVTPSTVPTAPRDVVVTRGDRSLTLTWNAPEWDGGSPVLSYIVRENFVTNHEVTGTTLTVRAPPDGKLIVGADYAFTVVAVNDVGEGASSPSTGYHTVISRPSPPSNVTATRGNASAIVSWSPGWAGGGTAAGYRVTANDGTTWEADESPLLIEGLINGATYTFTVSTLSEELGAGDPSPVSNAVIPATVPQAPTGVIATSGRKSAQVTWTAPDNGGLPILHYVVTPSGGEPRTATETTLVVDGLQNGTPYKFVVSAVNDVGEGPASALSNEVVPASEPGAPSGVLAALDPDDPKTVLVTWQPPGSNEGSAITGYVVTASTGGTPYEVAGLQIAIEGLAIGTPVSFGVQARNAVGLSVSSELSNTVTPVDLPGAPAEVNATAMPGKVQLSWLPPEYDGGSPITGYRITSNAAHDLTVDSAQTSLEVTGLTNGTSYTFTVQARTIAGDGPGATSPAVRPVSVPSMARDVIVQLEDTGIRVSWTAPADDGGEPLTRYLVTLGGDTRTVDPSEETTVLYEGLTERVAYAATVTAENDIGTSAAVTSLSLTYRDREWAQWKPSRGASGYNAPATHVNDARTGLMWQRDPPTGVMTWSEAKTYCDNLTLASLSDWRLPTFIELSSIIDYSRVHPAVDTSTFRGPAGSTTGWYWSASASGASRAWARNFYDAARAVELRTSTLAVRCVR